MTKHLSLEEITLEEIPTISLPLELELETVNKMLPDDVLKKIYDNYFSSDIIIHKLTDILNSKESQNLNHHRLSEYLKKVVLGNKEVVEKLKKENPLFLQIYKEEIVCNQRHFKLIENKYESFAMAWLMYLYH